MKRWRGSVTLPADVHRKIKDLAKSEARSFTKQLEVILRDYLGNRRRTR